MRLLEYFILEASDTSRKRAMKKIRMWIEDSMEWKHPDDPPIDATDMEVARLAQQIGDVYDKAQHAKSNSELVGLLREMEKIVARWVEENDVYATADDEDKLVHEYLVDKVPLGGM